MAIKLLENLSSEYRLRLQIRGSQTRNRLLSESTVKKHHSDRNRADGQNTYRLVFPVAESPNKRILACTAKSARPAEAAILHVYDSYAKYEYSYRSLKLCFCTWSRDAPCASTNSGFRHLEVSEETIHVQALLNSMLWQFPGGLWFILRVLGY